MEASERVKLQRMIHALDDGLGSFVEAGCSIPRVVWFAAVRAHLMLAGVRSKHHAKKIHHFYRRAGKDFASRCAAVAAENIATTLRIRPGRVSKSTVRRACFSETSVVQLRAYLATGRKERPLSSAMRPHHAVCLERARRTLLHAAEPTGLDWRPDHTIGEDYYAA